MSLPDVVSGLLLSGRSEVQVPSDVPENAVGLCFQGLTAFSCIYQLDLDDILEFGGMLNGKMLFFS